MNRREFLRLAGVGVLTLFVPALATTERSAFEQYLKRGTAPGGGYLVPQEYADRIVERFAETGAIAGKPIIA